MGKINEQTLKEAADRLHIAWSVLSRFDCRRIDCDGCPLQRGPLCITIILGNMSNRADKMLREIEEEGNHDNH